MKEVGSDHGVVDEGVTVGEVEEDGAGVGEIGGGGGGEERGDVVDAAASEDVGVNLLQLG